MLYVYEIQLDASVQRQVSSTLVQQSPHFKRGQPAPGLATVLLAAVLRSNAHSLDEGAMLLAAQAWPKVSQG